MHKYWNSFESYFEIFLFAKIIKIIKSANLIMLNM